MIQHHIRGDMPITCNLEYSQERGAASLGFYGRCICENSCLVLRRLFKLSSASLVHPSSSSSLSWASSSIHGATHGFWVNKGDRSVVLWCLWQDSRCLLVAGPIQALSILLCNNEPDRHSLCNRFFPHDLCLFMLCFNSFTLNNFWLTASLGMI